MIMDYDRTEQHYKVIYYGPPMSGKATNIVSLCKMYTHHNSESLTIFQTKKERIAVWDGLVEQGSLSGLNAARPGLWQRIFVLVSVQLICMWYSLARDQLGSL